MERERHTHSSYGQIRFSRVNGTNRFYGSELQQDNYISMEIHTSSVERELSNEWFYNEKMVTRLRMSSNQFAELITSMNNGSGVPCTLEVYDGKNAEDLPEIENRKEFVHRKFEERMMGFAKDLKSDQAEAKKLIAKKTLSKQDQQDLQRIIDRVIMETSSNIPFFGKCFQENMDEVVQEAKSEIENAIQHKVTTLGLAALHEQNKLLGNQ